MTNARGRPKGWRPGMSYAEMRVGWTAQSAPVSASASASGSASESATPSLKHILTAASAQRHARRIMRTRGQPVPGAPSGPKRRGRPPKVPSPPPYEVYRRVDALFIAFVCEWAGCCAELQNLDTLRRHVRVVHAAGGKAEARCRWGKCAAGREAPDLFGDGRRLRKHVEEAHLVPLAWQLGDGPSNGGNVRKNGKGLKEEKEEEDKKQDDGIPDYLKDAEGRQVTPSIKDQEMEDWMTWRNNRRKLKELLIRMDENLPSEDSDASVDEEEAENQG